jgi:uncharacterized protein (DUF3820 family)
MIMPFGKHAGERVEDLPTDYLHWCLKNVAKLDPRLRKAMETTLGMPASQPAADIKPVVAKVEDRLKMWYRRATMKYHPDRGGSNEIQRVVNECYESLSEVISEIGGGR